MKKFFLILVVVLVVAGIGVVVFQEPLKEAAFDSLTSDMFVAADNDAFDPGLAVGEKFPAVFATANGATITDAMQYSGPNGLVFVANRSVDW